MVNVTYMAVDQTFVSRNKERFDIKTSVNTNNTTVFGAYVSGGLEFHIEGEIISGGDA